MNGYAQSKWVAEKLVLNSQVRGLPTVIFRLGMLLFNRYLNYLQVSPSLSLSLSVREGVLYKKCD